MKKTIHNKVAVVGVVHPGVVSFIDDYLLSLEKQTCRKFDLLIANDNVLNMQSIMKDTSLVWSSFNVTGSPASIRIAMIRKALELNYEILIFNDCDDYFKEKRIEENKLVFPGTVWLFPAFSKSGHISEPKVEFKTPFTIHGLRNTFITVADSIDVSAYAIKLLVNHSLPRQDVTAGYINHEVERLRAPMQQITLRLLNLVTPQNDKVISISAGKNK